MALVREPLIHNAASRPGTVRVADSVPMDRGTDTEPAEGAVPRGLLISNDNTAPRENTRSDHDIGAGASSSECSDSIQTMTSVQEPRLVSFVGSVVKAVISVLSPALPPSLSPALPLLSPSQAVLLYQQLYILSSCIQYSSSLAEDIRTEYREEFRYYIQTPSLEERFPLCYPITQPTVRLLAHVLELVEHKPAPQL
ncbi:UNVERIFIED_CONTAM: hypothetical protein FKN15_060449 [Acipenser sinensis]